MIWLGDSRAYLVRAGHLTQITRDQTFRASAPRRARDYAEAGSIVASQKRHSSGGWCGGAARSCDDARCPTTRRSVPALHGRSIEHGIRQGDARGNQRGGQLDETCARLIQLANTRAAEDNVILVCAEVLGDLPAPRADEFIPSTFTIM
jgi:serine/threonine protein phosphatase PrpC